MMLTILNIFTIKFRFNDNGYNVYDIPVTGSQFFLESSDFFIEGFLPPFNFAKHFIIIKWKFLCCYRSIPCGVLQVWPVFATQDLLHFTSHLEAEQHSRAKGKPCYLFLAVLFFQTAERRCKWDKYAYVHVYDVYTPWNDFHLRTSLNSGLIRLTADIKCSWPLLTFRSLLHAVSWSNITLSEYCVAEYCTIIFYGVTVSFRYCVTEKDEIRYLLSDHLLIKSFSLFPQIFW